MLMKNIEIYNHAQALLEAFANGEQKLPIKVNFYLQKNKQKIVNMAQEIDTLRINIISSYGILNAETQQYEIPDEKVNEASKELDDLFEIEQEVELHLIPIDNFSDDLALTTKQMEAIMFMIEE